jgi:hypothetical protein
MSKGPSVRCHDYVNRPYPRVREALVADAERIFQRATRAASARADDGGAALRVRIGALEVTAEIAIRVVGVEEREAYGRPATVLRLAWQAARSPGLFPVMEAELKCFALSGGETQLELEGAYTPPLGALGEALDRVAGHRIAEASVHRFIDEVASCLREQLPA